ncbi:hypothetical protein [Pueribacillus sp. YX66]|uniref:hypothetical protein n=1 Tax=Pueribacillus sp. YX66 TaxID=3229242 RepID=UPI00358D1C9A
MFLIDRGYRLSSEAYDKLIHYYKHAYETRDQTFGNADLARNIVFEANLDYRMARTPKEERDDTMMKTILPIDLNIDSFSNS